jgi:hypothetical protein
MPFVNELFKYTNEYFVETGTFQGDTLEMARASNKYNTLFSMELSDVFHKRCFDRFATNTNVTVFKGNSRYDLFQIIKSIDKEITFWLDSHWSGGHADIGCDPELKCPILYELDQIKHHHIKTHTIMVDDIRLMDGSHFLVTKDEIVKKILEINPEYTIEYYNDECADGDVLVAYIKRKCVHTYALKCETNPQPPGIADFIRGTICLYELSQKHHYDFCIDNRHPLFSYMQPHKKLIHNDIEVTHEFIPSNVFENYNRIYEAIERQFLTDRSFACISNSFYTNFNGQMVNWGKIDESCKTFLREIFTPNDEMRSYIQYILNSIHIGNDSYNVIHLRFGDAYIHDGSFDDEKLNTIHNKIQPILQDGSKYILLTDSERMGNALKERNPSLFYYNNAKIHLGDLRSQTNPQMAIKDTVADFLIISKAAKIYSNGSGFSIVNSILYDIEYSYL